MTGTAMVMKGDAQQAVRTLMTWLGEDPQRDGLQRTPERVARAWRQLCAGYQQDPQALLSTTFDMDDGGDGEGVVQYGGMVVLRDIEVYSLCEHHLLPFTGRAHVVYVPGDDGKVVGISKLARVVDVFARRLQCQERLTAQVADAIEQGLAANGAMVVVEATHFCMRMRGVNKQNCVMTTSEVRGVLRDVAEARAEALQLLRM